MNPIKPFAAVALCGFAVSASAQTTLTTDVSAIDVIAGGTQVMTMDAPAFPGAFHFLAGTSSGTAPGFMFGGLSIPLNPVGGYFLGTLNLGISELSNPFGQLDVAGQATAQFTLAGGIAPGIAGTTLHHAFVVITGVGPITLGDVSNAASLDFVAGTPTLVISEFMKDPNFVGDNNGEYVEIYNPGGSAVDIEGWSLADMDNDSTVLDNGGGGILVPAGGYFVLGANSDPASNGNVAVDFEYIQNTAPDQFFLSNSADEIRLVAPTGVIVDEVVYDDGVLWPETPGVSLGLNVGSLDVTANDDPLNWAESTCTIAGGPLCNPDLGTPGIASDQCNTMPCGANNGTGDLLVTEIMQNPSAVADSLGEWFEVYNNTGSAIDMNGYTIGLGGSETISTSLVVPAGGYVVFGRVGDNTMNGGVTVDYDYDDGLFLSNGSATVSIVDGSSNLVCQVAYDNGATFPDPNGASMTLNPTAFDVDMANDGSNWCEATSAYGLGDTGTPGAANDTCP